MKEYTRLERSDYRPPNCPACARRLSFQWSNASTVEAEYKTWVPSGFRCPDRTCENSEPSMAGIPRLDYSWESNSPAD